MQISKKKMAIGMTINEIFLISLLCLTIIASIKLYMVVNEFINSWNYEVNNIVKNTYNDSVTIMKIVFSNNTNNK